MIARASTVILCVIPLFGCDESGPYPAEIQARSPSMEHCKERIVDEGNAIPIYIEKVTVDMPDLYAGFYENGKTFECKLAKTEKGEMYYSARYYETKWRD